MIEKLYNIFFQMWQGIGNVISILDTEFEIFGTTMTGLTILFGTGLISILTYSIIKWVLNIL